MGTGDLLIIVLEQCCRKEEEEYAPIAAKAEVKEFLEQWPDLRF